MSTKFPITTGLGSRVVSLGTGLSCPTDYGLAGQRSFGFVRKCPLRTALDPVVGHATGTVT